MLTSLLLAAPACALSPAPQSPEVTSYGCLPSAADSLTVVAGQPALGSTLALRSTSPAATIANGPALGMLFVAPAPAPGFPCGVTLNDLLPEGSELLLDPLSMGLLVSQPLTVSPVADWTIPIPEAPELVGQRTYLQALHTPVDESSLGFATNGLEVQLGLSQGPDLELLAVYSDAPLVEPGDAARAFALVRNAGNAAAPAVSVEFCFGAGGCEQVDDAQPLGPGESRFVQLDFATNAQWSASNPHFLSATVDPTGAVDELEEANNVGQADFALFVAPIVYPTQLVPDNEYIERVRYGPNGQVIAQSHVDFGPQGAPKIQDPFIASDKGNEPPQSTPPAQSPIAASVLDEDAEAAPGEFLQAFVLVDHGVEMPMLPSLVQPTDLYAPENTPAHEQRLSALLATFQLREAAATPVLQEIEQLGGVVLDFLGAPGCVLASLPKGAVQALIQHPLVTFIEGTRDLTVVDSPYEVREGLGTKFWNDLGYNGSGRIAVVDSGVRATHDLLSDPDRLDFLADCVHGSLLFCIDLGFSGYDPAKDVWNHGTTVSALIAGNSNYSGTYRGLTSLAIDSYRTAPDDCETWGCIDAYALYRSYILALLRGSDFVNTSITGYGLGATGTLSSLATDLYRAGCAVIAGQGNEASESVGAPANAYGALAVGAYEFSSGNSYASQTPGPTSDGRFKPDFQMPHLVESASSSSDSNLTTPSGTSYATAVATGFASVVRQIAWPTTPVESKERSGRIYAHVLNMGTREFDTGFDNVEGIGQPRLDGVQIELIGGAVNVFDGVSTSVEFDVGAGAKRLSATIWWQNDATHQNDIDLYLLKPSGDISDYSVTHNSVFERVQVVEPIAEGTRSIEIQGYDVGSSLPFLPGIERVYYSIMIEYL
ncbi:MAG: S8 family serine peptidase [Planctomycetota bacterium]|jgi:hypothetical protein